MRSPFTFTKMAKPIIQIMPNTVKYDVKTSPFARILYFEIALLSQKYGYCFATNEYFAGVFSVHPSTISTAIKELKARNHIKSEVVTTDRGSQRNLFPMHTEGGVSENTEGGVSVFADHNIIIDNNLLVNNKEKEKINKKDSQRGGTPPQDSLPLFSDSENIEQHTPLKEPKKHKIFSEEFQRAIEVLNDNSGRKFEATENDIKGKTDRYKLLHKILSNGYTMEQIEAVIADKCKEWFADKRNHKYMRLDTILAYSNFEKYLNDIKAGMPSDSAVVKMPNKPENLALEKEIIQMGYKCPPEELKALQSDFFKRYSSFDQAKRNEMIIRLLASDQAKQHGTIKKVLANLSRIISQLVNSRKNDDAKK